MNSTRKKRYSNEYLLRIIPIYFRNEKTQHKAGFSNLRKGLD